MMASKLFSKLGHKKKHLVAPPTPDVDYDKDTATSQNASVATSLFIGHREVELADDYSLPADNLNSSDSEAGLYSEPVDTLNKTEEPITTTEPLVDSQAAEPSAPPEELIEDATKEETSVDTPTTVGSEQDGEMSSSAGIYCNQVASYHTGSSNKLPSPAAFSPDADPRNNPAFGDEYECPWDLKNAETEIYEMVKQSQVSPGAPSIAAPSGQPKAAVIVPSQAVVADQLETRLRGGKTSTSSTSSTDSISKSHRVRQPSVKKQNRMSSPVSVQSKTPASPATSHRPNAVLVEGEWRESKTPMDLSSMSSSLDSPDLSSPAQIVSHGHEKPANQHAASNIIYDDSGDKEIQSRVRYNEEKRIPRAQPRLSIRLSSVEDAGGGIYQNFRDADIAANMENEVIDDNSALYEEPWNSDQLQQQLMEKIQSAGDTQRVKPKSLSPDKDRKHKKKDDRNARPGDLPSEISSNKPTKHVCSQLEKLSPRALTDATLHAPNRIPPMVPRTGPGQQHANKPVLVVHKTNVAIVAPDSARRGSRKAKKPGSPDLPDCQQRIGLPVDKTLSLAQQPWYHGAIQRGWAEDLLRKRPDGSFLVRDSTGSTVDKTLSLKNASGFIHIKIIKDPRDGTYILGQFSHPFATIMEMVAFYSRHKVNIKGAEHTYLETPVIRERY